MMELQGKYGNAKIFTDDVDETTLSQVYEVLNQEWSKDTSTRIMPDCHSGTGCVIGTTMRIKDRVVPNIVGVDIGCGVLTTVIPKEITTYDLEKLDDVIKCDIPSGCETRMRMIDRFKDLDNIICPVIRKDNANKSLGTLGGGNHFIEVDRDENGLYYLVIHTGSRHLGLEVAEYYQRLGYDKLVEKERGYSYREKVNELIAEYKATGRQKEIENMIKQFRTEYFRPIQTPKNLAYVSGDEFSSYIHDMKITQAYAALNRRHIRDIIMHEMNWVMDEEFDTIHNYIDTDEMILRKGAVSAKEGKKLIIPMNMRDGSLICIGKGNPDWNFSAPHGAGRIMSRNQARKTLDMEAYRSSMKGIYTTSVNERTIDEAPMVYKTKESILGNITDTVEVINAIKPIYNFKAADR